MRNVLAKLDLRDRVHAIVFAYESGLVRPGGAVSGLAVSLPGSSRSSVYSGLGKRGGCGDVGRAATMSTMKEQEISSKTAKGPPEEAADQARAEREAQERPSTRERIRRIIERHRETFDELAK